MIVGVKSIKIPNSRDGWTHLGTPARMT